MILFSVFVSCFVDIILHGFFKAETHGATNRCDTWPRHVAATNRLV